MYKLTLCLAFGARCIDQLGQSRNELVALVPWFESKVLRPLGTDRAFGVLHASRLQLQRAAHDQELKDGDRASGQYRARVHRPLFLVCVFVAMYSHFQSRHFVLISNKMQARRMGRCGNDDSIPLPRRSL